MKYKLTFLLSLILGTVLVQAQVTIGSPKKPLDGALLMLDDGTDKDGANAEKGLGLPRVILIDRTKLTIGEDDDPYKTEIPSTDWDMHTGLLVYNVAEGDICKPNSVPTGLHVWNGIAWLAIGVRAGNGPDLFSENIPDLTTGVGTVTDYEGNVYGTKRFKSAGGMVDAGIWTTENLYSLINADGEIVICPDGARLNPGKLGTNTNAIRIRSLADYTDVVVWGQDTNSAPTTNKTLPMRGYAKKFGLSYTYAQALASCPKGWSLPTHADWDKLADAHGGVNVAGAAMRANNDHYLANDGGTASNKWGENDDYAAFSGFNALPSGAVSADWQGTLAYNFSGDACYWSAITSGSYRNVVYHNSNLHAGTDGEGFYFSVRCKKDESAGRSIRTDKDIYHVASGHDLRNASITETVNLTWNPATEAVTVTESDIKVNGVSIPRIVFNPALSPLVPAGGTSSYAMLAKSMTQNQIDANLFTAKGTKLTFAISDGAGGTQTTDVEVRQTNKALTVNGMQKLSPIAYAADANGETATIVSNGKWELTTIPTINPAVTFTTAGIQGTEKDDNESETKTINYNVSVDAGVSKNNFLLFQDANTNQRFSTVLPISQCLGETDLTMRQYVDVWEAMYGLDLANDEPDTDGDARKNKNLVHWHYVRPDLPADDPKQSIYFSSMFGAERWMTTNLANTHFTPRTANPGVEWIEAPTLINSNLISDENAYYRYPYPTNSSTIGDDKNYYNAMQRRGLQYNWGAVTARENSSNGNQGNGSHENYQGICPVGWHMPSYWEWEKLVAELEANPTNYSNNTIHANHGQTAMDICEASTINGGNRSFSTLDGGLNILLLGFVSNMETFGSGFNGIFWSSSSLTAAQGWTIAFIRHSTITEPNYVSGRSNLHNVRCKKD